MSTTVHFHLETEAAILVGGVRLGSQRLVSLVSYPEDRGDRTVRLPQYNFESYLSDFLWPQIPFYLSSIEVHNSKRYNHGVLLLRVNPTGQKQNRVTYFDRCTMGFFMTTLLSKGS